MFQQCLKLGAENKIAVCLVRIKQRLFADTVAGEEQRLFTRIPDREREHPTKVLNAIDAVRVVKMYNGLCIRLCVKSVPAFLEIGADLLIIVDLAVEYY